MRYIRAERLKYKRTVTDILLPMSVLITAFFAWLGSGFMGYQYAAVYWWYILFSPGLIAVMANIVRQKEEKAGKLYSVFSMPINLERFEAAKSIVLVEKILLAGVFLCVLVYIENIIAPGITVYSAGKSVIVILVILVSLWQIPFCLWMVRKVGLFITIICNIVFTFLPCLFVDGEIEDTFLWIFFPYNWSGKIADSLLGIEFNGTYHGVVDFTAIELLTIVLSIAAFTIFLKLDAKDFANMGGKR